MQPVTYQYNGQETAPSGFQEYPFGGSAPAAEPSDWKSSELAQDLSLENYRFGTRLVASIVRPYGIAVILVTGAFVSTYGLRRFFPYPFLALFFAAVMASAWLGVTGPGLFAVSLSTGIVDYYFVRPYYSFVINAADTMYFSAFVFCTLVAS